MVSLQITLPEEMLIFVEAQATAGGFAGPGEYLQSLIAAAQREHEMVELERRFDAAVRAMQEGEPNPLSPEDWQRLQQLVLGRLRSAGGATRS
jgi:antitoxin ParD1/3/4